MPRTLNQYVTELGAVFVVNAMVAVVACCVGLIGRNRKQLKRLSKPGAIVTRSVGGFALGIGAYANAIPRYLSPTTMAAIESKLGYYEWIPIIGIAILFSLVCESIVGQLLVTDGLT
jgi:hypothetical protein